MERMTSAGNTVLDSTSASSQAALKAALNSPTNIASSSRTTHIFLGSQTGGGHLYPAAEGKTPFPSSWSGERVMAEISDLITDPSVTWKYNSTFKGRDRYEAIAVRDGIAIRVITDGEDIITAHPLL